MLRIYSERMGDLSGILNIFGLIATILITVDVFLLIYFGKIDLDRLKSVLTFISRKGIYLTPKGVAEFFGPKFTPKEMFQFVEMQDEHHKDRAGKRYGNKYVLLSEQHEDTKNIGLFMTKYVQDKQD